MLWLKANCSEEIASKKQEIDRLDCMIVHSPERAALDRAVTEEKVCHVALVYVRCMMTTMMMMMIEQLCNLLFQYFTILHFPNNKYFPFFKLLSWWSVRKCNDCIKLFTHNQTNGFTMNSLLVKSCNVVLGTCWTQSWFPVPDIPPWRKWMGTVGISDCFCVYVNSLWLRVGPRQFHCFCVYVNSLWLRVGPRQVYVNWLWLRVGPRQFQSSSTEIDKICVIVQWSCSEMWTN